MSQSKSPAPLTPEHEQHRLSERLTPEIRERLQKQSGLSPREFEVVLGLIDGMTDSEIATELGCSRHTVNSHLRRVYRKLSVSSRAEVVGTLLVGLSGWV